MKQWQDLLALALAGERGESRAGPTRSAFGAAASFDNSGPFPAVTTKRLFFETAKRELACLLRGYDRVEEFRSMGVRTWDANAFPDGRLGPVYGSQWRSWGAGLGQAPVDQLRLLVEELRERPRSRRALVSAWNVGELPLMCLPPCPVLFQASLRAGRVLDMCVYQRSADLFLGFPFDVAQHALIQRLLAREVGAVSGRLHFFLGDAHVYENHAAQAAECVRRRPLLAPRLELRAGASLFSFEPADARLVGYEHRGELLGELNA